MAACAAGANWTVATTNAATKTAGNTDVVIELREAESPHDDMFGDERLIDFVCQRRNDAVKDIIEDLTNEILLFSDRPDMADDFTVMALRKAR